jgi:hypothetical protein
LHVHASRVLGVSSKQLARHFHRLRSNSGPLVSTLWLSRSIVSPRP